MFFPQPPNEAERLSALHQLAILDTSSSPAIDRICNITRQVFDVPMVLVTLIDAHRQWFKANLGIGEAIETPRDQAFCNYTIMHDEVFVVPDACADRRFSRNSLVAGEPYIRFYAGAPLTIRRGIRLGSLCVLDTKPRDFTSDQTRLLKGLSRLVVDELWLHHLEVTGQAAIEMLSGEPRDKHLNFESIPVPAGDQIRAARGLLNWSIRELSEASRVSVASLKRIEGQGETTVRRDSLEAVVKAFKEQGVSFSRSADGTTSVSRADPRRRN